MNMITPLGGLTPSEEEALENAAKMAALYKDVDDDLYRSYMKNFDDKCVIQIEQIIEKYRDS